MEVLSRSETTAGGLSRLEFGFLEVQPGDFHFRIKEEMMGLRGIALNRKPK